MSRPAQRRVAQAVAIAGLIFAPAAQASIQSTFDSSAQGWTVAQNATNSVPATFVPAGGNPGGYITGTDSGNDPGELFEFRSPPSWGGDRGVVNGGQLSFDMKHSDGDNLPAVAIIGANGDYVSHRFDAAPSDTVWTHYSVPLFEGAGWFYIENGSTTPISQRAFLAILRSLERIAIYGDLGIGPGDTASLDNVRLQGPPGSDFPCRNRRPTRVGTSGPDYIRGTAGRDVISGLGGPDTILGLGGNDLVCAGAGADIIFGGPGADLLVGGAGSDRLFGEGGNDRLLGGTGRDRLNGGRGSDTQRQ